MKIIKVNMVDTKDSNVVYLDSLDDFNFLAEEHNIKSCFFLTAKVPFPVPLGNGRSLVQSLSRTQKVSNAVNRYLCNNGIIFLDQMYPKKGNSTYFNKVKFDSNLIHNLHSFSEQKVENYLSSLDEVQVTKILNDTLPVRNKPPETLSEITKRVLDEEGLCDLNTGFFVFNVNDIFYIAFNEFFDCPSDKVKEKTFLEMKTGQSFSVCFIESHSDVLSIDKTSPSLETISESEIQDRW